MNRNSAPAGLPHSCADMVRPSGVFTAIGLYFRSCPKPGCATVANKAVATVILMRRPSQTDIVIETSLFVFVVSQASTCVKRVKVGQGAWADWLGRDASDAFQNTRQAADVINRWCDAVRHIRSKRPRALSARRTIRKPSEADRVLRCCRISHLPHERASFDAAEPDAFAYFWPRWRSAPGVCGSDRWFTCCRRIIRCGSPRKSAC